MWRHHEICQLPNGDAIDFFGRLTLEMDSQLSKINSYFYLPTCFQRHFYVLMQHEQNVNRFLSEAKESRKMKFNIFLLFYWWIFWQRSRVQPKKRVLEELIEWKSGRSILMRRMFVKNRHWYFGFTRKSGCLIINETCNYGNSGWILRCAWAKQVFDMHSKTSSVSA